MTARRFLCAGVVLAGVLTVTAGLAAAGPVSWGMTTKVPGMAALDLGVGGYYGGAVTNSVACASAGNCVAGGDYLILSPPSTTYTRAFVTTEENGVWGNALEVPGLAAVHGRVYAEVLSVSCGSPGDCSAGGYLTTNDGEEHPFVTSLKSGVWGVALMQSTLPAGGKMTSLSCRSAGSCSAGGYYLDEAHHLQAFVVSERDWVWGTWLKVPGLQALNVGGSAVVHSVSCATPGYCVAGGHYRDGFGYTHAFVVSQTNNVWDQARDVPGTGNPGNASTLSVSCTTPGNCSAGGYYRDTRRVQQAFVATETNGTWAKAIKVRGTGTSTRGHQARVSSVSCIASDASPSNCSAGGYYRDAGRVPQPFVVNEKSGVWGIAKPFKITGGGVWSVSCAGEGNCAAGGSYRGYAFVARETNWVWAGAVKVPGTAPGAGVTSVSCVATGRCSLGGVYNDVADGQQAFVTSP